MARYSLRTLFSKWNGLMGSYQEITALHSSRIFRHTTSLVSPNALFNWWAQAYREKLKCRIRFGQTRNKLVINGVARTKICGIHCEGENIQTFMMDLPSPKLYRITNMSKIKLFKNLNQMSLLPNVIKHLLCLKEVALKTSAKIEAVSLYSHSNLKRPASNPPVA